VFHFEGADGDKDSSKYLGHGMEKIEGFAREGAMFVFGGVLPNPAEGGKGIRT
jgi:hypothetical protein